MFGFSVPVILILKALPSMGGRGEDNKKQDRSMLEALENIIHLNC